MAGNWSGGTPANGQNLCFPASATNLGTMQDDLPGLTIAGLSFSVPSGTEPIVRGSGPLILSSGDSLTESPLDGFALDNPITLDGPISTSSSAQFIFGGPVSGPGGFTSAAGGYFQFWNAANTFSGGIADSGGSIYALADGSLGIGPISLDNTQLDIDASGDVVNSLSIAETNGRTGIACNSGAGNPPIVLSGSITLTGPAWIAAEGSPCVLTGPIAGAYPLTLGGMGVWGSPGPITVTGDDTYSGGSVLGPGGPISISGGSPLGTGPVSVEVGATLNGTGTIGNLISAGRLAPGGGVGHMGTLSTGSLTLSKAGTFTTQLVSPTTDDSVKASGPITLSGASLNVIIDSHPSAGNSFTIIHNLSGQPVSGTFAGLPEGATFAADGADFLITYRGNGGQDVVITAVPPPTPPPSPTASPITSPSPSPSPSPTATPAPPPTPTPSPGPAIQAASSPTPTPGPGVSLAARPTSSPTGVPAGAIGLGAAALVLLAAGLSLALPGPIRRWITEFPSEPR